jgi:hypothetical protein
VGGLKYDLSQREIRKKREIEQFVGRQILEKNLFFSESRDAVSSLITSKHSDQDLRKTFSPTFLAWQS